VKVTGRFADGARFTETLEAREAPLAAIDHLWARARVVELEDEFRATQSDKARKEIIALSIQHTVLTRFTAFVVIDQEVVHAGGQRRTVVQPVAMPAEWAPQPVTLARGPMLTMAAPAPAGAQPTTARAAKALGGGMMRSMRFLGRAEQAPETATQAQIERV